MAKTLAVLCASGIALLVTGCGTGGSVTTVVEKQIIHDAAPTAGTPASNDESQDANSDDSSSSSSNDDSSSDDSSSGGGSDTVPDDLVGQKLDAAEDELDSDGISYKEVGGGTFGIVVRSNWEVCETRPGGGDAVDGSVHLIVDRPGAC